MSAKIAVIGIGAMGGGMARALLDSSVSSEVRGYDRAVPLMEAFYQDAQALGKAPASMPTTLKEAVSGVDYCILVLVNEAQCDSVCFGSGDDGNILDLLPKGSCVILSSTVTAVWAKQAAEKFTEAGISFLDCPISGGPARARQGDLSLFCSGQPETMEQAKPILDAMGREVHIVEGGAGMGSTVKMVHQLLAGVHIVAAAEALALAAKAGLDVEQMYQIVNSAAGASWMFQDRGQRMIAETDEVKSALQIFVKDLDIAYSEAKHLQSPIPIASAALQQFIAGQSLGLSRKDDSQVIQVYEQVTGVTVAKNPSSKQRQEGDQVGDLWKMEDGSLEEILEVGEEPRHKVVLSNEYVRALRVSFPPNDTTLAHKHDEDSLYFFLVKGGLDAVNHVQGCAPACDCMEFGEVRFGTHKSDKPLVHKITNKSNVQLLCIDAEVLQKPPVTAAIPLVADKHELIKTRDKVRVYKLTLEPGESVTVDYPFFHFSVIVEPSTIEKVMGGRVRWTETLIMGDVAWKEPLMQMTKKNVGESTFVEYISEWL